MEINIFYFKFYKVEIYVDVVIFIEGDNRNLEILSFCVIEFVKLSLFW